MWRGCLHSVALSALLLIAPAVFAAEKAAELQPASARHVVVYQEPERYGGWPANQGIWSWGDEIIVGFTAGWYKPTTNMHAIDSGRPMVRQQARSLDGGSTWKIETPFAAEIRKIKERPSLPAPLDFTRPDFALMFQYVNANTGPSHFFTSTNRCQTWNGPFALNVEGINQISARTDILVLGPRDCLMFGSAAKANGKEGRVFCARTADGGLSWKLVSLIGPEPEGYAIMPASLRLKNGDILTTVRRYDKKKPAFIEAWLSSDEGRTWKPHGIPAPNIGTGNPPSLVRLTDGRLCLAYGYRAKPFGMRARISTDEGTTWSPEIILRHDAVNNDLGYPRSVARPDGSILTAYYFNGPTEKDRTIQATLWKP